MVAAPSLSLHVSKRPPPNSLPLQFSSSPLLISSTSLSVLVCVFLCFFGDRPFFLLFICYSLTRSSLMSFPPVFKCTSPPTPASFYPHPYKRFFESTNNSDGRCISSSPSNISPNKSLTLIESSFLPAAVLAWIQVC